MEFLTLAWLWADGFIPWLSGAVLGLLRQRAAAKKEVTGGFRWWRSKQDVTVASLHCGMALLEALERDQFLPDSLYITHTRATVCFPGNWRPWKVWWFFCFGGRVHLFCTYMDDTHSSSWGKELDS